MTATAEHQAGPVSRNCKAGNHTRCLGTVYTLGGLVTCHCPVSECGHGTDTAKAKARR